MKHVSYLVTLALLVMVAVSSGYAGKAGTVKGALTTSVVKSRAMQLRDRESDVSQNRVYKSSAQRRTSSVPLEKSPTPQLMKPESMTAGLLGDYHIPGDFPNIASAVAVLNYLGIDGSGDVNIILDNATYTEPTGITFGAFPNAGMATVTIKPKLGVNASVEFVAGSIEGKGFSFNGAKGVTIDGINDDTTSMTLKYSSASTFPINDPMGATIYITGKSDGIAIQNCNIEGIVNDPVWANQTEGRSAIFLFAADADDGGSSNLTFDGNTITNATYAFKALTEANGGPGTFENVTYSNNHVGGAYGNPVAIGALAQWIDNFVYDGNIVDGVTYLQNYWYNLYTEYDEDLSFFGFTYFMYEFGQATGGHFLNCIGTYSNFIHRNLNTTTTDGDGVIIYGTRAYGYTAPVTMYNARFYNITDDDNLGAITGIRGPGVNAYHCSVRLTGTNTNDPVSTCLNVGGNEQLNCAFSNEITQPTMSLVRGINPGGTIDGCAIYSAGKPTSLHTTVAAAVGAGVNVHGLWGPVNFDSDLHITSGPSSAENVGLPHVLDVADIDGDTRDTTNAGVRDAGADEFPNTGMALPLVDVFPTSIPSPVAGGVPTGLAQTPKVVVKNNSTADQLISVHLTISDGYDQTAAGVNVPGHGVAEVTFPTWTPVTAAFDTITAVTIDGSDGDASNDTTSRLQPVSNPVAVTCTTYTWNSGADGWTTSGPDWALSSSFAKLGGPYDGASWVTKTSGDYTTGNPNYPGVDMLTSPFLDLSLLTDTMYISFYQSMATEPSWDRGFMQYTTDGVNWFNLGTLDDPNGINWYATTVYHNAAVNPDCIDEATAVGIYNLVSSVDSLTGWTSNGDCTGDDVTTGPFGYVYVQLRLTTGHPLVGASLARLRYVFFSDYSSADAGVAIDNFQICGSAPTLLSASFGGTVYTDANGDGANDAMAPAAGLQIGGGRTVSEAGVPGVKVELRYFGVLKETTLTDGSGNYNFVNGLGAPGTYSADVVTTLGVSQPAAVEYSYNYTSDGIDQTGKDFGLYDGYVSGTKFNDLNNDGVNNDAAGFSGFTIQVHKDSCAGALYATGTTGVGGAYTIGLPPGTWYVSEVQQDGYRRTYPAVNCQTVTVSGASGSGTAQQGGIDFGNFAMNTISVSLTVDVNGNGVKEGTDSDPLSAPLFEVYEFSHNGVQIALDTLGLGEVPSKSHSGLDTGTYVSKKVIGTPEGWVRTLGADSMQFTVTTSGASNTMIRLDYKNTTVSGVKFEDVNGNGVKDGGEPVLSGWTINLTGTGGGSTVSDTAGNYSFADVGPGSHTLSEVAQSGWVASVPAGGTTTFSNNSGVNKVQNFGNFRPVCVSGAKYRDLNNNGTRDPGEPGLAGWKINFGTQSAITDGDGNYSFCDVGPGTDTLSEVSQAGYVRSEPAIGYYLVTRTSGVDNTGLNFGNYNINDSTAYRTFTVAQLAGAGEAKKAKKPKAGKPILGPPNTANLLDDLLKFKGQILRVGLTGQLNAGGKEKVYLQPKSQSNAYQTWNKKGVIHTGPPRGFDLDVKGKLMLKRWKSMPANKKNDVLAAEMLALALNLLSSDNLNTPPGLGDLIISRPGNPWDGQTINQFKASADNYMTNWEGVPFATYDSMQTLAALINGAFATGSTGDTAVGGGWFSAKLQWAAGASVVDVPFLKAGKTVPHLPPPDDYKYVLPQVYTLYQNYPNPFNPTTSISFDLPEASLVTVKVYNMLGQEVATLLNNEALDAGNEEVEFDASGLASGVYMYRITASSVDDNGNVITKNAFTTVKKMMLVK